MKNIFKSHLKTSRWFVVPALVFAMVLSSCEKNIDLQPYNRCLKLPLFKLLN